MLIPSRILLAITQFCQNEITQIYAFFFPLFFLQAPVINDFFTIDKIDTQVIFKELQICMWLFGNITCVYILKTKIMGNEFYCCRQSKLF